MAGGPELLQPGRYETSANFVDERCRNPLPPGRHPVLFSHNHAEHQLLPVAEFFSRELGEVVSNICSPRPKTSLRLCTRAEHREEVDRAPYVMNLGRARGRQRVTKVLDRPHYGRGIAFTPHVIPSELDGWPNIFPMPAGVARCPEQLTQVSLAYRQLHLVEQHRSLIQQRSVPIAVPLAELWHECDA